MKLQPYRYFAGRCEEAIAFCTKLLAALTDRFGFGWMIKLEG